MGKRLGCGARALGVSEGLAGSLGSPECAALPQGSPGVASSRLGGLGPMWAPWEGVGHMVPVVLSMGALTGCPLALGGEGRVFATAALCRSRAGVPVRAPASGCWSEPGWGL